MGTEIEQNQQGSSEDFGVVDEPLTKPVYEGGKLKVKGGEDQLKIKKHANALVQFIKRTNTPITIGVQGEWGSGKTSLLNTIYADLALANQYPDSKDFRMIWVNTWESALMSTPEEALIKIINEIINDLLEADKDISNRDAVKKAATTALKGMLRVGASVVGGTAGANVMEEVLESTNSVKELRDTLTKLVANIRKSEDQRIDKVVIFVDDLDRIDPPDAVKILELLKNIFSIPGCVFVLAIDYQVVIKGLKEKFGERTPENEWEFKAFFDKIIQLPFLMPMGSYHIGNYVNDLLKKIGFQDESRINGDFIKRVVDFTIGGNPRSIKRLINSLALINMFDDQADDDDDGNSSADKLIDAETERELLFGLVCLQIVSSDVYSVLSREPDFLKWNDELAFTFTQKKEEQDKQFQQNFEAAKVQDEFDEVWEQALYRICYANPRERSKSIDLSNFFNLLKERFVEQKEIDLPKAVSEILGRTVVTSVVATDDTAKVPSNSYKKKKADLEIELDGTKIVTSSASSLWLKVMEHMDDNDLLAKLDMPWGITRTRVTITDEPSPKHPNGKEFFAPVQFDKYTIESHASRKGNLKKIEELCAEVDVPFSHNYDDIHDQSKRSSWDISVNGFGIEEKSARATWLAIMKYLDEQGLLSQLKVPWGRTKTKTVITDELKPEHPDGKEYRAPVQFDKYTIESHASRVGNLKNMEELCKELKLSFEEKES